MGRAELNVMKWFLRHELFASHPVTSAADLSIQKGRCAVITGGTRGIGLEVVKKLLELDMTVIIGCRNPSDAEKAVTGIRSEGITSGSYHSFPLDLMSLASVRNFATSIIAKNFPINVLINNAGIMAVPYKETPDGFESHFQVNYLSHFLLSNLLLPQLQKVSIESGICGKIVSVAAALQTYGKIDFDNLELKKDYVPFQAYFNTKLMQVLMTKYLDAKLRKEGGSNIQLNSLHPGVVATDLGTHLQATKLQAWLTKKMMPMTVEQAANEILYVSFSKEVENNAGEFFVYGKVFPPAEQDPQVIEKLWNLSMELTGLAKATK